MKRASLSATPKWRPSTSKATPSIPSGITPSSPVPAKHQVEALISRSLLKLGQPRGGAAALRACARDLRESARARANRPGSEASSDRVKPGHDGAPALLLAPVPRAPGAFPTEIGGIDLSF